MKSLTVEKLISKLKIDLDKNRKSKVGVEGFFASIPAFVIDEKACKSCGMCAKACPVSAITGEKGSPYVIDDGACVFCGSCRSACKFNAVSTRGRFDVCRN